MSKQAVAKFPLDEIFVSELANANAWYQMRVKILREQVNNGDMTEKEMEWTLIVRHHLTPGNLRLKLQ
jgi:hypothetical protein